jgi:beta-lactam-binding protein with PASTA domain
MSRTFALVSSTLVCASVACTVNGHAIGPHFTATPTTATAAAAPIAHRDRGDLDNQMLVVPDVLGMSVADANKAIRAAGFPDDPAQGPVSRSLGAHLDDADCRPGVVCGQDPPAGEKRGSHTRVDIEVGNEDDAIVIVPNLIGMSQDDAAVAVLHAGFKQGPGTNAIPRTCTPGRVCTQGPAAGERVKRYTIVTLEIGAP